VVPPGLGRRSRYVLHLGPEGFINALSTPRLQATFIHELTYVWQQGRRASSAVKTKELGEVGQMPAGAFALDFERAFAGIPA
jgi:hypothetical protein